VLEGSPASADASRRRAVLDPQEKYTGAFLIQEGWAQRSHVADAGSPSSRSNRCPVFRRDDASAAAVSAGRTEAGRSAGEGFE